MRYSATQFAQVLRDLVRETPPAKGRSMMRDFLAALARQSALGLIPEIMRAYEELKRGERGVRSVTVRAPERISESGVARKLPFKSQVDSRRDVRLRGGVLIEVGDVRVDNSLAQRLVRLREALVT